MIYVRDKGRMCNNILQYGHLYAWGREHGRKTLSMRFAYKYPYFAISHTPGHNFFRYLVGKFGAKLGLIPVVSFDEKGEDTAEKEREMMRRRNIVAQGWEVRFYDLFLKYFDDIKELFAFDPVIAAKIHDYITAETLPGSVKLGVHIRRGDYARWQDGRYYFDDDVFVNSISRFRSLCGKPLTVYICGNDPMLDKRKYQESFSGTDVKIVFAEGNPGEDLCLLSECDYIMGPPSTFSLVSAMYRDVPLYWIKDPKKEIEFSDFGYFRDLFKEII